MDWTLPRENRQAGARLRLRALLIATAAAVFIIADRAAWASVSRWLEDQATNIWLGYTQPLLEMPVGLVSSYMLPNLNGMALLGALLSRLPGLWAISTVLGVTQAALLAWLCWTWFGRGRLFAVTAGVLLSSAVLRVISVEYWNQWVVLNLNVLFFIILGRYLRRPSLDAAPGVLFCVCCAPTLYLAGIVNAAAFLALAGTVYYRTRRQVSVRGWRRPALLSGLVLALFLAFSWLPYLRAAQAFPLIRLFSAADGQTLLHAAAALVSVVTFPAWSVTWIARLVPAAAFFDAPILPASAGLLISLQNIFLVAANLTCLLALSYPAYVSYRKHRRFSETFLPQYRREASLLILCLAFVLLSFALIPLLKGPFVALGERADMTLQFLPFFLVFWFGVPLTAALPPAARRLARQVTVLLAVGFAAANIALGGLTVAAFRGYAGKDLLHLEVPLKQKLEAARFIAADWSARSGAEEVPIYYDFEVVLPPEQQGQYGYEYAAWYPAPFTLGRAIDYQLLRVYGLRNTQEGLLTSQRAPDVAVYVVRYSFLPEGRYPDCFERRPFGPLTVWVRAPERPGCARQ